MCIYSWGSQLSYHYRLCPCLTVCAVTARYRVKDWWDFVEDCNSAGGPADSQPDCTSCKVGRSWSCKIPEETWGARSAVVRTHSRPVGLLGEVTSAAAWCPGFNVFRNVKVLLFFHILPLFDQHFYFAFILSGSRLIWFYYFFCKC